MSSSEAGNLTGQLYWVPDWNNAKYKTAVSRLLTALSAHVLTLPAASQAAFWGMDISCQGNWGELSSWPLDGSSSYFGTTGPNGQIPLTLSSAQSLVTLHSGLFTGKQLLTQTGDLNILEAAMRDTSRRWGLRIDSLGAVSNYGYGNTDMKGAQINMSAVQAIVGAGTTLDPYERWKTAPVVTEWATDTSIGNEFTQGATQVAQYHVSLLSSGNWPGAPTVDPGDQADRKSVV